MTNLEKFNAMANEYTDSLALYLGKRADSVVCQHDEFILIFTKPVRCALTWTQDMGFFGFYESYSEALSLVFAMLEEAEEKNLEPNAIL